jgi:protein transport protein SEC61 subunit gamma-like protein
MEANAPWTRKFGNFIRESKRVLKVTKKPTKEEFKTIVKVSALGMAVIGLIGFLIILIKQTLFAGVI